MHYQRYGKGPRKCSWRRQFGLIPSNHCINCLPDVNLFESLFDAGQTSGNIRSNGVTTVFGGHVLAKISYS